MRATAVAVVVVKGSESLEKDSLAVMAELGSASSGFLG